MRYLETILIEGSEMVEGSSKYRITRVEQRHGLGGFSHAWAEKDG
jgi:hypothetical protein